MPPEAGPPLAGPPGADPPQVDPPGADPAPAGATATPPEETGLDLARSVAERIAAAGRGTRRRRRTASRDGAAGPDPGSGRGTRSASAPGRVGGLASRAPFTGPGPDANDPTAVGSALHELVAARGWAPRADASAVLARWSDLVGEQTAEHCQPVGLDDGTLRVRADSSAWATQLRLLAPRVVAAVNERVGSAVVQELVVDGPVAPSWRHGRLGVQGGRGPRDTYG